MHDENAERFRIMLLHNADTALAASAFLHASATRMACAPIMKEVTVCTGGACARNGALQLHSALCTLSAEEPSITVKHATCSSVCPKVGAILSPMRGRIPAYTAPCSTPAEACASAEEALQQGKDPMPSAPPALMKAYLLQQDAEAAADEGDLSGALEAFSMAVDSVPPALFEPSQPPLEPEDLVWDASEWTESFWASELICGESLANYEYGTCGTDVTLVDCTVDESDEESPRLVGYYENAADGASGEFNIAMSSDGRRFSGTLTDDADGETHEWSGARKVARRVGQRPSPKVQWLHSLLVRRSQCQLDAGAAEEAAESAAAATQLCCRTASGWEAYAEAKAKLGDEEAAADARAEALWLK